MRLGIHLPIADGLARAVERAQALGCQSLQLFSGNPRSFRKLPLDEEQVAAFRAAAQAAGLEPLVVHATYLINLAAPDENIYRLSVEALIEELRRAAALGARYYVVHCGSHKGTGEEAGRARIRAALTRAAGEVAGAPGVLLENTAGTANSLGTTFADLAALLDGAPPLAAGICFDTCHALAAGYEVRTAAGAAQTLDELDRVLGLARLRCLHVNDSKGECGSHLDRHEHIGLGAIGAEGFRAFLSDRRVWELPAILETPLDGPDDDRRNMRAIAELACAAGAIAAEVLARIPEKPLPSANKAKKKPSAPARTVIVKGPLTEENRARLAAAPKAARAPAKGAKKKASPKAKEASAKRGARRK